MMTFYEDAAHLLLFLTRAGLVVNRGTDCRQVIARIALMMLLYHRDLRDMSHSGAAEWIMDDLTKSKLIAWPCANRRKVVAILGTAIGNLQSRRAA